MCGIDYVSVLRKLDLRNSRERERIKRELPVRSAVPSFAQERLDPGLKSLLVVVLSLILCSDNDLQQCSAE